MGIVYVWVLFIWEFNYIWWIVCLREVSVVVIFRLGVFCRVVYFGDINEFGDVV